MLDYRGLSPLDCLMFQQPPGSYDVDWTPQSARDYVCPVCQVAGPKRFVLAVPSQLPPHPSLRLYACDACGSLSFPEVAAPSYASGAGSTVATQAAVKFYIEQGAAPDTMVEPLFWLDRQSIHRYAEVGCGFGFSLDFAREALGWSVQGYDPSPAAVAGREQLDLPITPAYLGPESLRGVEPYDLILASEVIEHLPDPHGFLTALAPAIRPSGWLILTTPNAAGVHPTASPATLLPLLTPGYHLVLFSATSLARLLEDHGFIHHCSRETATTLTIIASRQPFAADPHGVLDRGLYRAYLQRRLATLDPDSYLAHGWAGRLFKEQVNAGDFPQALETFSHLATSIRRHYALDLDDPDQLVISVKALSDFSCFAAAWPMNLCGLAYRRGFLALHHERQADNARRYFMLGDVAGSALREALRSIGADDGETEHLVELCRLGTLEAALAAQDRPAVSAWLDRLTTAPASTTWQDQAQRFVAHCFSERVLAGDHGMADLLIMALPGMTPTDLPPHADPETSRLLLARGLYALNRERDATRALAWLVAAREQLKMMISQGDEDARALLPTLISAQVYAQATASPAEALVNTLVRQADAQRSAREHLTINAEIFQRLVHAGAYREAAQLEPLVLTPLATLPAELTDTLAFTLGILALNFAGDHAAAHCWFVQVAQLAAPGSELALQASALIQRTAPDRPAPASYLTPDL